MQFFAIFFYIVTKNLQLLKINGKLINIKIIKKNYLHGKIQIYAD